MNSWRTISQKKCSIAHSFIHSFFKPCFYRSFMQKFYRALRFYPTCHISYTDLSHDDGARTIKLRREKTRMTFFSIDKTDGSVEGSTRWIALNAHQSLFLFLPPAEKRDKFDHPSFNSCYLPVWVNVVFDQFHPACQEISCVSLRYTGTQRESHCRSFR